MIENGSITELLRATFHLRQELKSRTDCSGLPDSDREHLANDAKFVVDTAFDLGAPVPAGQMLLHLYRLGVAQGWGDEDISAIMKVLEHLSGK